MIHSITLNNRNTLEDFGLILTNRNVEPASIKRTTTSLPQVQGVLDFSRGPQGESYFGERQLTWEFSKAIQSEFEREQLRYDLMQWVHSYTDGRIYETVSPGHFYRNCTCLNIDFPPPEGHHFKVKLEFVGYPFRQSDRLEGAQTWDDFNFNTDVWQDTLYQTLPILDQLPFKPLEVGTQIHLGGWTQLRDGGVRVGNYETERSYEIIDVRDLEDTDYSKLIYSGIQYQLDDNTWVREQDIVEAREGVPMTLYNVGIVPVVPDIRPRAYISTTRGITIEVDGKFYNFHGLSPSGYTFNDKLSLPLGRTDLKLYGQGTEVNFVFRKEVL